VDNFSDDDDLRLRAEAEAEAEFEFEQELLQSRRKPEGYLNNLGTDYDAGYLRNAFKSIEDAPGSIIDMGVKGFDTLMNPGSITLEGSLNTIGTLAGGAVGGIAGGLTGLVTGGLPGAVIGGSAGGAAGMGLFETGVEKGTQGVSSLARMLGYDDYANNLDERYKPKSLEDKKKDFLYNTVQGGVFGGGAALAGKATGKVVKRFTKSQQELNVANELSSKNPNLLSQIDEQLLAQADDPLSGGRSLAELVDSNSLRVQERAIARSGVDQSAAALDKNQTRNDAQLKYLDGLEPATTWDATDIQGQIRADTDSALANAESGVQAGGELVENALSDLPKESTMAEGTLVRGTLNKSYQDVKDNVSAKFNAAGDDPVNLSSVKEAGEAKIQELYREVGAQPDAQLTDLLASLERAPTTIKGINGEAFLDAQGRPIETQGSLTLKDAQAIRSKALDLGKNIPDKRAKGVASTVADSVDQAVKDSVPPQNYQRWEEGRAARKEQGVDYESKSSPSASILNRDPLSGAPIVPDSMVLSKYVRADAKGGVEAARNYKKVIGNTEEALEPIYKNLTDSFRSVAYNDGKINTQKARSWLDRHAGVMNEFPELKAVLSNTERAQTFLNEMIGVQKRTQSDIQKSSLKNWLQVEDPAAAVDAMLTGKDSIQKTRATFKALKDEDARKGLRREMVEWYKRKAFTPSEVGGIQESSTPGSPEFRGTVKPATFTGTNMDLRPLLKEAGFTENQIKGFDYLYNDKKSQISIDNAKSSSGSDSVSTNSILADLGRLTSTAFLSRATGSGLSGQAVRLMQQALSLIPKAKFNAILENALLDPRIAKTLLEKANSKNLSSVMRKLFDSELTQAGLTVPVSLNQSDSVPVPASKPIQSITSKSTFPNPEEILESPKGDLKKK